MPSKYLERNLVKYRQAICLCFDDQGDVCLYLRNFEDVLFHPAARNPSVKEILVGKRLDPDTPTRLELGSFLSVLDAIRFQRAAAVFLGPDPKRASFEVEGALKAGLRALGIQRGEPFIETVPGSPANGCRTTKKRIADELQAAKRLRTGAEQDAAFELLGFVGYFPKPCLIGQEERTLKGAMPQGKTANSDNRELKAILSRPTPPAKNALDELLDELDEEVKRDEQTKRTSHAELARKLISSLNRVHCFAYRGDSRDAATVKAHGGLLPSFTRDAAPGTKFGEQGFAGGQSAGHKIHVVARLFDDLRTPSGRGSDRQEKLTAYIKQLKDDKILDLAEYTASERFRGYLSTTKSTAIAKCFANLWAEGTTGTSWCYAVRCNGGYELKSHLTVPPGADGKTFSVAEKNALHEAVNYLEQEVAMPGGVFWDQVVGFRCVEYNQDGQFFAGPVFLREPKYWKSKQDEPSFDQLFEQLSGAAQGDDPTIRKSYKQTAPGDPWSLVPNTTD